MDLCVRTSASCHCSQCCESALTCLLCSVFAAHNVTLEEILSSYKQACQKLNCKPIPKVLKQIQVRPTVLSPCFLTDLLERLLIVFGSFSFLFTQREKPAQALKQC